MSHTIRYRASSPLQRRSHFINRQISGRPDRSIKLVSNCESEPSSMKVLSKLLGLKTATDYATVLPELEADLATASERLARLKAKVRTAPFEAGEGEVKRLRQEIRDVEDEIDTLTGVRDETLRRQEVATHEETDRLIRDDLAAARQSVMLLESSFEAFDRHIAEASKILTEAKQVIGVATKANVRAGVDSGGYSTSAPPKFFDERARLPTIDFGDLAAALDQLGRNGVAKWFETMRASGKLR